MHEPLFPAAERDDLSSHAHRQLIGTLGLVFPFLLWLIAAWRPTEGLPQWGLLGSVSAYYYTGAVAVFVGILAALGVFLFTYRGYDNEHCHRDRFAATVAGVAAIMLAFFPSRAPRVVPPPPWWTPPMGRLHFVAAVILFGAFIYISVFLFPKSRVERGAPLHRGKGWRNLVYRLCGVAMAACILWAGIASHMDAPIFWPEGLALEFFAVSWLVKGRADWTAVAAGRRTLYYGRRPALLARNAWSAIRGHG